MINLLPPEVKQDYQYARSNRRLLRWSCAFLGAIAGVVLLTGVGLFFIDGSTSTHKADISKTELHLASQHLTSVQQEVTDISNNLKLMVGVLSKEILFSKLLGQLGSITPSNVVMTNLSISQTQTGVDITAQALNYNAAAQLQANLADPNNQIFSKADIVSINCANATSTTTGIAVTYPCTTTIRALFKANNPFLFINADTKKAGT